MGFSLLWNKSPFLKKSLAWIPIAIATFSLDTGLPSRALLQSCRPAGWSSRIPMKPCPSVRAHSGSMDRGRVFGTFPSMGKLETPRGSTCFGACLKGKPKGRQPFVWRFQTKHQPDDSHLQPAQRTNPSIHWSFRLEKKRYLVNAYQTGFGLVVCVLEASRELRRLTCPSKKDRSLTCLVHFFRSWQPNKLITFWFGSPKGS